MDGDEERMLGYFMSLKGSPFLEVKELKEKGSDLFRKKFFDKAAACYDEACKLLGLSIGDFGGEDVQYLCDLAVSLNSNLAACALKLEEFRAASDLCSMILDTFPHNVKALFRRALASMKLKRFKKANSDLVQPLLIEPKNKDILKELEVVKGHLLIKENGKRILEVSPDDDVAGKNKKPIVQVSERDMNMKVKVSENISRRLWNSKPLVTLILIVT